MPRPCKRRRICKMPACGSFGPQGEQPEQSQPITMTLDEFETIRLIDLEGMSQEQCARQMDVARSTAQAIYGSARRKVAKCLVKGQSLRIEGGNYVICDGASPTCEGLWEKGCQGEAWAVKKKKYWEEKTMKIAVTYENGQIYQHFGHTEYFKVYDVENGAVVSSKVVDTNGSGHGALAGFLLEEKVDVLICGGIGGGARQALAQAGIALYGGASGEADVAVETFLKGMLAYDPNATCSHHGEHHGEHHSGSCGSHGCGSHHCGE